MAKLPTKNSWTPQEIEKLEHFIASGARPPARPTRSTARSLRCRSTPAGWENRSNHASDKAEAGGDRSRRRGSEACLTERLGCGATPGAAIMRRGHICLQLAAQQLHGVPETGLGRIGKTDQRPPAVIDTITLMRPIERAAWARMISSSSALVFVSFVMRDRWWPSQMLSRSILSCLLCFIPWRYRSVLAMRHATTPAAPPAAEDEAPTCKD
ncbi:hypothetical protein [Tardiphaga sp.]|uniref:hypothetical protein n=1 Tax=Tardiphaga sp. TaxID=1926292 RepID=UPI00262A1749|nr:hypothetical protein [Tardiphaga sp.]MDB5616206.1 hypothetical protein [Tardiphaga sp.]